MFGNLVRMAYFYSVKVGQKGYQSQRMNSKDYKDFVKALEKQKKSVSKSSPSDRKRFLHSVGVLSKKGNLTKSFKQICIPKDQD